MNKRGISGIVATVIMIGIVIGIAVVVWVVVNNLVESETSGTESCFGIYGKISLNERYTCYDSGDGKVQFSISIADVEVDEILVRVSSIDESKTFAIGKEAEEVTGIQLYNGTNSVWAPKPNSGLTYVASVDSVPDSIEIVPVIDGNQCEISDTLTEIVSCSSLL
jgi:flagellin-like protein